MKKLFRYLRKQPKHIRDRYAFLFSFMFILVVIGLWLPPQLQDEETEVEAVSEEVSNPPFATLFSNIKKQVANAFSSFDFPEKEAEVSATTTTSTSTKIKNVNELQLSPDEVKELRGKLNENATSATRVNQPAVLIATTSTATTTKTETD